jgi:Fis family transcriptional regulator
MNTLQTARPVRAVQTFFDELARHTRGCPSPPQPMRTAVLSPHEQEADRRVHARRLNILRDLRGTEPAAVHDMVLRRRAPMLDVVLRHADGNQSLAAEWLGINRNTCAASCWTTSSQLTSSPHC